MPYGWSWSPYVSVAERRRRAAGAMAKRSADGHVVEPVTIQGRAIATTPWGKAWCSHLEGYGDYANRLPRGRTYVRNGSVVDLRIASGAVAAHVSGSEIYRTDVTIAPLPEPRWRALCADCAGGIDSLVELLQGRLAGGVMARLCRRDDGLFPSPREIRFDCSCPDDARMCKHVAAVLYGVGARLDRQPELLFTLRGIDPAALIAAAGGGLAATSAPDDRALADGDVAALFGVEMEASPAAPSHPSPDPRRPGPRAAAAGARRDPADARAPGKRRSRAGAIAAISTPTRGAVAASSPIVAPARDPFAALVVALRAAGSVDNASARDATGLDADAVRPLLRRLVAEGRATVAGIKRGTRYVAVDASRRR